MSALTAHLSYSAADVSSPMIRSGGEPEEASSAKGQKQGTQTLPPLLTPRVPTYEPLGHSSAAANFGSRAKVIENHPSDSFGSARFGGRRVEWNLSAFISIDAFATSAKGHASGRALPAERCWSYCTSVKSSKKSPAFCSLYFQWQR
eukprot:3183321-Pleurochrysis_carterae.AAC.1